MRVWPKRHATSLTWGQNSSPRFWQGGNTWVAHSQRNTRPQRQQPLHKNLQPKERRPIHNKKTTHKTCIWQTTIVSPSLHNYIIKWDHCSILYHQFIQHQHPVPVQAAQDGIHNYVPCATTHSHLPPLPNHVWQFVTQGRSKFLIQNYPFSAFIKLLQVQIPIFWHTFHFQI